MLIKISKVKKSHHSKWCPLKMHQTCIAFPWINAKNVSTTQMLPHEQWACPTSLNSTLFFALMHQISWRKWRSTRGAFSLTPEGPFLSVKLLILVAVVVKLRSRGGQVKK